MQPNHEVSSANLGVNGLALGSAVDAARREAEGGHEEVMRRGNILANENRDETLDFVHT
jgi:hypothetical protein